MKELKTKENIKKGEGNMKLEIFRNAEFGEVRTIVGEDGEPWFVGKDIATALGYSRPTKAIQDRVDIEDRDEIPIQDSIGRKQKTPIINESGLYSLILSSKLESAKRFKRWVTSEVLPSIRKTGSYGLPQMSEETKALVDIFEAEDKVSQVLAVRKYKEIVERPLLETIEEQEPKAEYHDNVLSSEGTMPLREIVKCFKNLSSQKANRILVEHGIIYRQKRADGKLGKVIPRQETQNKGYMKQSTRIDSLGKTHQDYRWTELGKNFLVEFFQELGFVLIEK